MNILTNQTLDKGSTPKDIMTIRNLIEREGIEEYEKNTLNFISEYMSTYIVDILSESKHYASYAERHKINIEDVKMAVKLKQNNFYSKKPETSVLKEIAKEVNSIPLSNIPDTPQILLPPPEHSLIRNNFQIYSEEILNNFSQNKSENIDNKSEEELVRSKRHSMIGLKRRDYDNRPGLILSKKKIKLNAVSEEDHSELKNNNINNIHKNSTRKISEAFNKNQEEEDMDNIFDNEDRDSLMNREDNFFENENSENEDFNYDNTFS